MDVEYMASLCILFQCFTVLMVKMFLLISRGNLFCFNLMPIVTHFTTIHHYEDPSSISLMITI